MKKLVVPAFLLFFLTFSHGLKAQFLMDMVDTTKELGKKAYSALSNYNHIRISGYLQPEFQVASEKGIPTYAGGDFAPNSDNRFTLRRGRIRFDYGLTDAQNRNRLQFVFQFDGSERGVFIRDFWGRYWENKWELLAFTSGMFARPFGFEVNLSSSDRESPERGRMSQILMKSERDLGFMASLENRRKGRRGKFYRFDIGVFNGQGLNAPGEFDSYKDIIAQLVIRPQAIGEKITAGGGVSVLHGGLAQNAGYSYRLSKTAGTSIFVKDSLNSPPGAKLPRQYYGANSQWKFRSSWGFTEIRAEYWRGTQTGSELDSETPSSISTANTPLYVRPFDGAFFYFLQHIINTNNQFILKFDWYDPNTAVKGTTIGSPGTNFTEGDIKYSTLGIGFQHFINENFKLLMYYDFITNEQTSLPGYTDDRSDNLLTIRAQFRF